MWIAAGEGLTAIRAGCRGAGSAGGADTTMRTEALGPHLIAPASWLEQASAAACWMCMEVALLAGRDNIPLNMLKYCCARRWLSSILRRWRCIAPASVLPAACSFSCSAASSLTAPCTFQCPPGPNTPQHLERCRGQLQKAYRVGRPSSTVVQLCLRDLPAVQLLLMLSCKSSVPVSLSPGCPAMMHDGFSGQISCHRWLNKEKNLANVGWT